MRRIGGTRLEPRELEVEGPRWFGFAVDQQGRHAARSDTSATRRKASNDKSPAQTNALQGRVDTRPGEDDNEPAVTSRTLERFDRDFSGGHASRRQSVIADRYPRRQESRGPDGVRSGRPRRR